MGKSRDAVIDAIHFRLLKSSEDDLRAHVILQNQPQGKKKFIIEAILAYDASKGEVVKVAPAPGERRPDGGDVTGAETIMARLTDMESHIIAAIENRVYREPSSATEPAREPAPSAQFDIETGFNDDDVANFQLAREAFGSLAEEDD